MTEARSLTGALGGKWSGGGGIARCPAHDDRTPSLSLADAATGKLLLHCHAGCTYRDIRNALVHLGHLAGNRHCESYGTIPETRRQAEQRQQAAKRAHQARRLWQGAAPVTDTLGEKYLRGRGITCALAPTLRYEQNCWHQSARRLPAIIAMIEGAENCAVHRTYVRGDGSGKANVSPVKAMLGCARGGAVRLSGDPGPLVVAEGIETALSLLSGLMGNPASVWAALSAGGMKALRLPKRPGKLVIASDGDAPGQGAARALAERAHVLGWKVSMLPAPDGFDWNDVLTGRTAA